MISVWERNQVRIGDLIRNIAFGANTCPNRPFECSTHWAHFRSSARCLAPRVRRCVHVKPSTRCMVSSAWPGAAAAARSRASTLSASMPRDVADRAARLLVEDFAKALWKSCKSSDVGVFVVKCIKHLPPAAFTEAFNNLPQPLRSAAGQPPADSEINPNSFQDDALGKRASGQIHALRLERYAPVAAPSERQRWVDDSCVVVQISAKAKDDLWDLFKSLPVASACPLQWNAVLSYIWNALSNQQRLVDSPVGLT